MGAYSLLQRMHVFYIVAYTFSKILILAVKIAIIIENDIFVFEYLFPLPDSSRLIKGHTKAALKTER